MQRKPQDTTSPAKSPRAARPARREWSLAPYLNRRLVILPKGASIQEAARAMEKNRIGAILVEEDRKVIGVVTDRDLALFVLGYQGDWEPRAITELLHRPMESVPEDASLDDIVSVMIEGKVRRIPIVDSKGHARGIITLDDLLAEGRLTPEQISDIIWAQLAQPMPLEKGGGLRPSQPRSTPKQSAARAPKALLPLLDQVAERADFTTRAEAEQAVLSVLGMVAQRLTPEQARHLISQLPVRLAEYLGTLALGPDVSIDANALLVEVSEVFQVPEARAKEISRAVFEVLQGHLTGDLFSHVLHQLPQDLRRLLAPKHPDA